MSALVMWSGGLDSTLALYRALTGDGTTDGGAWSTFVTKDGQKTHAVRTLTVQSRHIAGQRWLPRSRKRIAKALRTGGFEFEEVVTDIVAARMLTGHDSVSVQPALWVTLGSLHLAPAEDLWLGWNREEQRNADRARAAFDDLQRLSNKTGKLVFPLEHHTKADVIVDLQKARIKGLVDASWWCEGTVDAPAARKLYGAGKPCRVCTKCEEITTARFRISNLRREHDITGATA